MTDTPDTGTTGTRLGGGAGAGRQWVSRREYDPDGEGTLTTAIVTAVAEAEGVAPSDLRSPLSESVDVEALEAVFFGRAASNCRTRNDGFVEFGYTDRVVTVTADGQIGVSEPTGAEVP